MIQMPNTTSMHVRRLLTLVTIPLAVALSGCASEALFITSTSVGINADAKTGDISLAYDREAGFIGPTYATGTPSTTAAVDSSGEIFKPNIRQAYATGNASIIALGGTPAADASPMSGTGKRMYFGTNTTTGLKFSVSAGAAMPEEFIFGFKRQEVSVIPLLPEDSADVSRRYASTLAFYDMKRTGTAEGEYNDKEYFATGEAAELLAQLPMIQSMFQDKAMEAAAVAAWDTMIERQRGLGTTVVACYQRLSFEMLPSAWSFAARDGLLGGDADAFLASANTWYQQVSALQNVDASQRKALLYRNSAGGAGPSEDYLAYVMDHDDTEERFKQLLNHSRAVCSL